MTRGELVNQVREQTGMSKKDCTAIVDAVFASLQKELQAGNKVQISGFGTFEVRKRQERKGFNPTLKKEITIAQRCVPVFKAGKRLREALNR